MRQSAFLSRDAHVRVGHTTSAADHARIGQEATGRTSSIPPYPFGPVSSVPGGCVVERLLDAVDGGAGSTELVGYLTGDVGRVAVLGRRMAVLVQAVVGLGQHLVCGGQHDDCGDHGDRADGEGYVPVSYTHLRAHETGRNLVCRL